MAGLRQNRELFVWIVAKSIEDPDSRALFRGALVQPRGPTVIALQRAMARGELDPSLDADLAMHMIQGPLMSMRIVDNTEVTDRELDTLLDMTLRALGGEGTLVTVTPPRRDRPAVGRRSRIDDSGS